MERSIPQLSAGSMADIAFLLLVFFLVATTIPDDEGISAQLPPIVTAEGGPSPANNVLEIQMNAQGDLLVEGKLATWKTMQASVSDFYRSSGILKELAPLPDMPKRKWISARDCDHKIAALSVSSNAASGKVLKKWNARKAAIAIVGPFRELPTSACILIDVEKQAPYAQYIALLDAIEYETNLLKTEFAKDHFGRDLKSIDAKTPEDIALLNTLQLIYPKAVIDKERD